jgi:uncharacterized RDD family membrane protein YckC
MNSNEFDKDDNLITDIESESSVHRESAVNNLDRAELTENKDSVSRPEMSDTKVSHTEVNTADGSNLESPQPENRTEADRYTTVPPFGQEENLGEHHRFAGIYAGFWMRFWAYLLDLIVIGSINRMILNPVFRALDVPLVEDGIISPMGVTTAVVFYLYFVLMTKFYGQTLGKMVFGLRVVELDGNRLSWGTVIFREWIGRFISATVMVLYVVVAFTKKKQGLHDLFADTTVIYEPR